MKYMMLDDKYARMPWDEIDTVVFDIGGVLIAYTPDKYLEKLFPDDPAMRTVMKTRVFSSPYWHMMDRGLLTQEEAIVRMTGLRHDLADAIRHTVIDWTQYFDEVIDEGVRFLNACRAHGKKVFVLSNFIREPFAQMRPRFDFFDLFDELVVSGYVHKVKPSPDIFQYVIDTYQLNPARTLFIDDSFMNIEACLFAGWQGVCFNVPGKLDALLAE